MTPLNPHGEPRPKGASFVTGVLIGLGSGLALTCLLSGVGYAWVQKTRSEVRKGWNLVPVVVAAQDIAEGTPVTLELLSQRSVPEQFVTPSIVKPDQVASIINQSVRAPVSAGDPLSWQHFDRALWSPLTSP
jgi:pilus assembly protein CpaB